MADKSAKKESTETKETSKPKCGIIMPISPIEGYPAEHWAEVKEVLLEVISQTQFDGDLVSNSNEIRVIHETIVQNIYFNEMVVCDVSGKNPNVMFELGLRIAFDKPVVVIKDDATNYSFDTSPIEHITYPTDLNYRRINQFKKELRNKIETTYEKSKQGSPYLKSFGRFEVTGLDTKEIPSEQYIIKSLEELKVALKDLQVRNNNDLINIAEPRNIKNRSNKFYNLIRLDFKSAEDTQKALEYFKNNKRDISILYEEDDVLGARSISPIDADLLIRELYYNAGIDAQAIGLA